MKNQQGEFKLTEISRETYGNDDRAINRHSERRYHAPSGNLYVLSKTLDGLSPFYEAYGPFTEDHQGCLPRLLVNGKEYWGGGWNWKQAYTAFSETVSRRERNPDE